LDAAVEQELGVRVQPNPGGLPDRNQIHVALIDPRAHLHPGRVHDVQNRGAGTHFLALLDFGLRVAFPHLLDHDEAGERRLH
jgi:hypothetical protein